MGQPISPGYLIRIRKDCCLHQKKAKDLLQSIFLYPDHSSWSQILQAQYPDHPNLLQTRRILQKPYRYLRLCFRKNRSRFFLSHYRMYLQQPSRNPPDHRWGNILSRLWSWQPACGRRHTRISLAGCHCRHILPIVWLTPAKGIFRQWHCQFFWQFGARADRKHNR